MFKYPVCRSNESITEEGDGKEEREKKQEELKVGMDRAVEMFLQHFSVRDEAALFAYLACDVVADFLGKK